MSSDFSDRPPSFRQGAALMVGSALLFAAMSAAVKAAAHELPNAMVVFLRNALSLALLAPWVISRGRSALVTRHLREHLVRGLFGLAAMYCFFFSIAHLRLADAVLLTYTLPLFVPLVEWLWLGERLSPRLAGPLAVGFVGIVVILRPTPGLFRPVALLAVLSAVLAAIGQVGIRRLTATEPAPRIVFYFAAIATAISAVPAALAWVTPPAQLWPVVAAMGLLATGGQLLLTRAYSSAPAAWVGPFLYTSVVFSGAFDWLFWRVLPDGLFLTGSVLVVVAAVLTLKLRGKGEPEPA
ncbi:MAG TPA: DMT family transporter [Thermoanaerobaculia bacterium]|nr:DMT family transporter [Thermoanaerobaculia bacterium]